MVKTTTTLEFRRSISFLFGFSPCIFSFFFFQQHMALTCTFHVLFPH